MDYACITEIMKQETPRENNTVALVALLSSLLFRASLASLLIIYN